MRILLACPKPNEPFTPYGPPLGLCYISAYLKSKGYDKVYGIDLNVDSEKEFVNKAKESDVVGIYCSTKTLSGSLLLAEKAKKINPQVVTVLGGPHPTLCPSEVLSSEFVDFVVIQEGEYTFFELVSMLKKRENDLRSIKGLGWKQDGKIVINAPREPITHLDQLPFPDRELFSLDKYPSGSITITASRGCPYSCTNCQPALNRVCGPFRFRSVSNVIEEVKEIKKKFGDVLLAFVDNDLTVGRKWITDFCNGLLNEGIKIEWRCEGRINTLSEELMKLMKLAGCKIVDVGIESGSQDVLNKIRKGITLDQVKNVVNFAKKINFPLHAWFMIGIPGETKHDIKDTIEFAKKLDVVSIGFSIATPWPGTGFYELCKEKGWLTSNNWDEYNEKKYCRIRTDDFRPEEVERYRREILKVFIRKFWIVDANDFIMVNPFFVIRSPARALLKHRGGRRLIKQITWWFKLVWRVFYQLFVLYHFL